MGVSELPKSQYSRPNMPTLKAQSGLLHTETEHSRPSKGLTRGWPVLSGLKYCWSSKVLQEEVLRRQTTCWPATHHVGCSRGLQGQRWSYGVKCTIQNGVYSSPTFYQNDGRKEYNLHSILYLDGTISWELIHVHCIFLNHVLVSHLQRLEVD